jgi:hypothetical protein
MVKNKRFGVVNVVAQPHPEGTYRRIFEAAGALTEGVNFFGDSYARLSPPSREKSGIFRGRLAVWMEIDQSEPIIFKGSLEQALLADTDFNVPSEVGFNSKVFFFSFREHDHTFFVELENDEGGSISVNRVVDALNAIFGRISIPGIESIDAYVKTERFAVDRVLSIPTLRKVEIVINIPNPDDLQDDIAAIYQEMVIMGAKQQKAEITKSRDAETLTLSPRYLALANVAKDTGFVKTEGFAADGSKQELSTREHPQIIDAVLENDVSAYRLVLRVASENPDD